MTVSLPGCEGWQVAVTCSIAWPVVLLKIHQTCTWVLVNKKLKGGEDDERN